MAAFAHREIIPAESPLAIVTTHTALRAGARVMVQRLGRSHLSLLGHSRPDLMAFVAIYFLMFGVTETDAESLCEFRSAPVGS